MDLSALTELFGNLAGFFGGFKDVFSGLGAIFENGAALSSGSSSSTTAMVNSIDGSRVCCMMNIYWCADFHWGES
jgi:hypothetical protein